jgi:6-phosphofructokinase 1
MTDEEIKSTDISFTYDDHGHPELGNVSKAHIFNLLLQRKLKELNISVKSRPEELGYELRCVSPSGFDLMYCSLLGLGVKKLFDQGFTGCMVTSAPNGDISPLFLKDVTDEKGKVKPRLVNINSQKAKLVYDYNLQFIGPEDYNYARRYVPDPENYDFLKILNW